MPTIRLDPAQPVLWRDADTVQIGAEAALTLSVDGAWVPRVLHALMRGIDERAFEVIAHSAGAPLPEARRLRARLAPVLVGEAARYAVRLEASAAVGARTVLRLEEALADARVDVTDAPEAATVLVRHGAVPARDAAALLAEDRAHLPVAFDAGGSVVGPLVLPGRSPCLSCRDSHDRERDHAWAALHVQLMERDPGRVPLGVVAAAADAVADLLAARGPLERSGSGRRIRIRRDGGRSSQTVEFHADCLCRSPQGSATGVVLPGPRPATRSASALARPA
ncbi:hypothetical protein RL72_00423 [Microbacterium azadirachtae]|uniref:Bacteriocin biosynthesis cyclodehydratase domain-containing protein n=1 Tax=Microbacterium azadirachtae TaxID=582680 RepID=A0A0F0L2T7_9MICO|nr:hypothetical protein RL72_00423 [Microbacterium azadirachtae]